MTYSLKWICSGRKMFNFQDFHFFCQSSSEVKWTKIGKWENVGTFKLIFSERVMLWTNYVSDFFRVDSSIIELAFRQNVSWYWLSYILKITKSYGIKWCERKCYWIDGINLMPTDEMTHVLEVQVLNFHWLIWICRKFIES